MSRIIYLFIILFVLASSCQMENKDVSVIYRVSNATADTEISFRDENGNILSEDADFQSLEDKWHYALQLKQGEIVYLTALYHDSSSSVNVEILIDGKIYKQKSSVQEPEKYVIASGIVPF